jgi:hypothetical protein
MSLPLATLGLKPAATQPPLNEGSGRMGNSQHQGGSAMHMTRHAEIRCQQRAIPAIVAEWLVKHGEKVHDHRGACVRHFTKRVRQTLERTYGKPEVQKLSRYLDCYCVVSTEDIVLTVGHRYTRIRH